jgi:hypothetical protein
MQAVFAFFGLLLRVADDLARDVDKYPYLSGARTSSKIFDAIMDWDYCRSTNFVREIWGEGWRKVDHARVKKLDEMRVEFSSMRSQSPRKGVR